MDSVWTQTTLCFIYPIPSFADIKSFFVQWELLKMPSAATVFTGSIMNDGQPGAREMHGTCSVNGTMLISGGRNDRGLLSDVWILQLNNNNEAAIESSGAHHSSDQPPFEWRRCSDLELSRTLCSHGASVIAKSREFDSVISSNSRPSNSGLSDSGTGRTNEIDTMHGRYALVITGGFSGDGISDTVMMIDLCDDLGGGRRSLVEIGSVSSSCRWTPIELDPRLESRFGSAVCCLSRRACHQLVNNPIYAPVFSASLKSKVNDSSTEHGIWTDSSPVGALIFGGVCMEKDFGDLHLLLL